jgi:hypothetical protein
MRKELQPRRVNARTSARKVRLSSEPSSTDLPLRQLTPGKPDAAERLRDKGKPDAASQV